MFGLFVENFADEHSDALNGLELVFGFGVLGHLFAFFDAQVLEFLFQFVVLLTSLDVFFDESFASVHCVY